MEKVSKAKLMNALGGFTQMNIKRLIIFLAGLISCSISWCGNDFEEKKLEPAILRVVYERIKVTDTLKSKDDYSKDLLTLQVGKDVSAFYSAQKKTEDSISERNVDYMVAIIENPQAFEESASLEKEVIFKNYPYGKNTVFQRFDLENWVYTEDIEKPEWKIINDSSKIILDYQCMLAVCNYRGRTWIAWFTPEIPISDGPWKLSGLPGIILEAYDSKQHYHYTAISLRTDNIGDVEYFNYSDRLKTERIKSLIQRRKALGESIKNQIVASGAFGIDPKKVKLDKGRPAHTNYDFEETDYPHK